MKLYFEDNLDYQQEAISSVVDLFKGQEINRTEFTVAHHADDTVQGSLGAIESALGIGNKLGLQDEEILQNLRNVQLRNGLQPSELPISGDFTVEMETGTGKTYVYLRTIFELNKCYGFSKFVIVVPSVAIKEGTYKTLQITREHFENLYPMAKGYEYFQYDSAKPGTVRNFATSLNIQIMVVTVGAINKRDVNNLYKENEKTGGEKPIDLVRATNPIIIVDEPQSVDGGMKGQGRKALEAMNPLCTLRYSATHIHRHHMVYRLDAVDAYERGLVKQIEVAALEVEDGHNKPFVGLMSTHNKRGPITAKIEFDVERGGKVSRQIKTVEDGDDLQQLTGRELYRNFRIGTIKVAKNDHSMILHTPEGEIKLRPGEEYGSVDPDEINRLMIRRTIKEHLHKEMHFAGQQRGVKVLSLFFIDKVEFYRQYNEDGSVAKGKYARMFEEEYQRFANNPDYQTLCENIDLETEVDKIHNGYFSIDKKGGWTETAENNQANRDNAERAYNLIMRDKERLLSFASGLRFIFSHSALKEGWDNPNVFQICTLRNIGTELQRRQTIGRGLRLCVNQQGQRLRGFDVNTLTVIANEGYEQFAENLQREIEKESGIRFGMVEMHQFAGLPVIGEDGNMSPLGAEESEKIWTYLRDQGFIAGYGRVQDTLRAALKEGTLSLPKEFADQENPVKDILKKLAGRLAVKNADERITIRTREAILKSEAFRALWERIKHKTMYRVNFDNPQLVADCADAIRCGPSVPKTRVRFRKVGIAIGRGGVETNEATDSGFTSITENNLRLPDLLTRLEDKTRLTRKSIVEILIKSQRLEDFKENPQRFVEVASEAINRAKREALVDGIRYRRIGDSHYYAQELFQKEELTGYLKNTLEATKSVHNYVAYDSIGVEKSFAESLEHNDTIKVYAKLPGWFKIPTPLGSYNPDWAIVVEDENQEERLYFVVETKASEWWDDLRHQEGGKIACGKKHFAAISQERDGVEFKVAKSLDDVLP